MKTYNAVVLYRTPRQGCRRRPLGGIVANSTREARRKARDLFEGERARMTNAVKAVIIGITLEQLNPSSPIQNGDEITVPITGIVELDNDGGVSLRGGSGLRIRMRRQDVERKTGRPVAPPPPVVTVEYYSLYPNEYCYRALQPVRSSQHGLDQLVQVRVTKHDGKIVDKQIV